MHGKAQYGTVRKSPARHNSEKCDQKNRIKGPNQKLELDKWNYVRIDMISENSRWKDPKI